MVTILKHYLKLNCKAILMAAWTFLQAGHLGKKAKFRKLVWTD